MACAENSFHQSRSVPLATAAAVRLSPRCASIMPRSAIDSGSASNSVNANMPASTSGAPLTRRTPSRHAAPDRHRAAILK